MAVNFTTLLYSPVFDMFAVSATLRPLASKPGHADYSCRGIFATKELDVISEGDTYEQKALISDQLTIFDIREAEFAVLPQQGDHVIIPTDCNDAELGEYEIIDATTNGGGETTLTLRVWKDF